MIADTVVPQQGSVGFLVDLITNVFGDPGCALGLFSNDLTPTGGTVLADVVSSAFTGYVASVPGFDTAYVHVDGAGNAYAIGVIADFVATVVDDPVGVVYGAYIASGDGRLLAIARFPVPVMLDVGGKKIQVLAEFSLPDYTAVSFEYWAD